MHITLLYSQKHREKRHCSSGRVPMRKEMISLGCCPYFPKWLMLMFLPSGWKCQFSSQFWHWQYSCLLSLSWFCIALSAKAHKYKQESSFWQQKMSLLAKLQSKRKPANRFSPREVNAGNTELSSWQSRQHLKRWIGNAHKMHIDPFPCLLTEASKTFVSKWREPMWIETDHWRK